MPLSPKFGIVRRGLMTNNNSTILKQMHANQPDVGLEIMNIMRNGSMEWRF